MAKRGSAGRSDGSPCSTASAAPSTGGLTEGTRCVSLRDSLPLPAALREERIVGRGDRHLSSEHLTEEVVDGLPNRVLAFPVAPRETSLALHDVVTGQDVLTDAVEAIAESDACVTLGLFALGLGLPREQRFDPLFDDGAVLRWSGQYLSMSSIPDTWFSALGHCCVVHAVPCSTHCS